MTAGVANTRPRGRVGRWLAAAVLALPASAGCATLPGRTTAWVVESVALRGDFLDATVSRAGETQRFFTPASPACGSVLRVEALVEYVSLGPFGQFQSGAESCDLVGIGSLAEWRDRRPRPNVRPLPTRSATYRLEYQDAELAMLRGRIPLVGLLGFVGMGDTLMVLPQSDACRPLIPRGTATIEYRVAGPDPLVLIGDHARCAVLGLIQPPPPR
jgi:hypothetical protein